MVETRLMAKKSAAERRATRFARQRTQGVRRSARIASQKPVTFLSHDVRCRMVTCAMGVICQGSLAWGVDKIEFILGCASSHMGVSIAEFMRFAEDLANLTSVRIVFRRNAKLLEKILGYRPTLFWP